jgi:hypothetical protein
MNFTDSCLQRLFRAAARTPEPLPAEVPFGLEARILASWRRGAPSEESELLPLVRGACICACAIILITAALNWRSLTEPPPNELMIVDSVIRISLIQ